MRARLIPNLLILFSYFIILVIVFGKVLNPPAGQMIYSDDYKRQHYWYQNFFVKSIKSGEIPWWNPYLFAGMPFMSFPTEPLLYPPMWLMQAFPIEKSYPVFMMLHILSAMCGMYWLLKVIIKSDSFGAWASGLVFGLSGFFMARVWAGHSDIVPAASYIPWVIGFIILWTYKNKYRYLFLGSVFLALQILSGYPTMAMFTIEMAGIIVLFYSIINKSIVPIIKLLLFMLSGLGLAAVDLIPKILYFQQSIRTFNLGYEWSSKGAMLAGSYRQLIDPFIMGDQRTFTGPWPNYHEQAHFAGRIMVVMGAVYVISKVLKLIKSPKTLKQNIVFLSLVIIIIFSVWVALGPNAPWNLHYLVWQILPMYKTLRFPSQHMIQLVFAFSVLGGLGINLIKNKILKYIIVVILIIEMIPFAGHFIETDYIPQANYDINLIQTAVNEKDMVRLVQNFGVWIGERDYLDFNAVSSYKIFSVTGYDPIIYKPYYAFIDALNGADKPSIDQHDVQVPYLDVYSPYFNYLNIKYIMVPRFYDSIQPTSSIYKLVIDKPEISYRLYENLNPNPRFFLVHKIINTNSNQETLDKIRSRSVNLTESVLISGYQGQEVSDCPEKSADRVDIKSYSLNNIMLETNSNCPAILVSSEVNYPGWGVWVDGKKISILTTNSAFRGAYISEGKHLVEIKYFPIQNIFGIAVSCIICICWIYPLFYRFIMRKRG